MYVLDTNTIKVVLRNPTAYLEKQITSHQDEVYLSVIVAEEMIKGVLSQLSQNMHRSEVTRHYDFLQRLISDLNVFPLLPYTDEAERIYQAFSPAIKRVGLRDCRIAASAMAQLPEQFTVVTRNIEHFKTIGARCVNWIDEPTATT